MSSALVRVLYRSLLDSARQLEKDSSTGRSLYNALRSAAVDSYDDVRSDWQRERRYESRLRDAKVLHQWSARPVTAATLVRTQFEKPLDPTNRLDVQQRLDSAFGMLREIDDHNALVKDLMAQGAFTAKAFVDELWFNSQRRSKSVQYRVGDVVEVNEMGVGVVVSWTEARAHAYGELHVTYDVLPDTSYHSDRSRLHRVPQAEIRVVEDAKPVQHPCVLVHFDGYANGRHIPCSALAQRFPDDVASKEAALSSTADSPPQAPSILQLQFADEQKLVQYLRCDDSTVIQFACAALEGKWISECGEDAQTQVRRALREMDNCDLSTAKDILQSLVQVYPGYAYAWSKLASVELKSGNFAAALQDYERAAELKPEMVDALAGVGTCATRLRRWNVAHSAAMRLLSLQPHNETARLLLDNAILSSL